MGRAPRAAERLPSQRESQALRDAESRATQAEYELAEWKAYVNGVAAKRNSNVRKLNALERELTELKLCKNPASPASPATEATCSPDSAGADDAAEDETAADRRSAKVQRQADLLMRTVRLRQGSEVILERTPDDLPDGCRVYRKVVPQDQLGCMVPPLQERADLEGRLIKAGQKDHKRRQFTIDSRHNVSRTMLEALDNAGELDGRKHSEFNVLDSLPGCKEQRRHWDYDPGLIECLPRGRVKPASAILALQAGTRLYVYDEIARTDVPVALGPGDMLVFDGDVAHHATCNTRVHVYLDVDMVPREGDVVWFHRW